MQVIKKVLCTIYDKLGDNRTKNILIMILALMSAFGIVAPDVATGLRDEILRMAL